MKRKPSRLLSNRKYIDALRPLFVRLTYGAIPITQLQSLALSEYERTMVKTLKNVAVDKVRTYIKRNESSFLRLFDIIYDSLKLITRTYERHMVLVDGIYISFLYENIVRQVAQLSKLRCPGCDDKLFSPLLHLHEQLSMLDKLRQYFEEVRGAILPT